MRQAWKILAALLAALPQTLAAQTIGYLPLDAEAEFVAMAGHRLVASEPMDLGRVEIAYGPFRVVDETRAQLRDVTDAASPDAFATMLRDHPAIRVIEMVACPGTVDDRANLQLGRMIRSRDIETFVPAGGWVGSGAVELFLAGSRRSAQQGAQFGVHSWQDDRGFEASDYAPDAPANLAYIDYYRTMGMSDEEAHAFYEMTNAVPFEDARWLDVDEFAQWVSLDAEPDARADREERFAYGSAPTVGGYQLAGLSF